MHVQVVTVTKEGANRASLIHFKFSPAGSGNGGSMVLRQDNDLSNSSKGMVPTDFTQQIATVHQLHARWLLDLRGYVTLLGLKQ